MTLLHPLRAPARRLAGALACLLATSSAPLLAHHSAAMFEDQKTVTLSGTLKQFQWSNPHCWLQVVVADAAGDTEWSVEMGSPSILYRGGWKPTTLHAGDKLVVVIHPMRDGSKGGLFVSATHQDGTPIETAVK